MNRIRLFILALPVILVACASNGSKDTIAKLRHKKIEIKEEKIEGGLEKAMLSYSRFLKDTPESPLKPEAIRRLADLKIEKEYGTLTEGVESSDNAKARALPSPERAAPVKDDSVSGALPDLTLAHIPVHDESEADFEMRATRKNLAAGMDAAVDGSLEGSNDLERAGAREAIALYTKLLNEYPLYERNDQVLYQMSRAYEELGQIKEAMAIMDRMVQEFPKSRYIDEVQFRRAEFFFAHKHYLDAEDAYKSIVNIGVGSSFYELALYKLGWTFYKQELYEDALTRFIAVLDHKVSIGYDFEQTEDEQEHKRTEDTFRVISLSFSNLGGADSAIQYFSRNGKRSYEDSIYSNLGEFYFDKRRYADASASYNAFVSRNPFHKKAPNFQMRVIEIQGKGGFPSLVLESKKKFAETYGLKAEYWKYFEPNDRPDVLSFLKTNLTDLANHYHACYQDKRQADEKSANFKEALHWYQEFLTSFPSDIESPAINYQVADLLLENKSFGAAAVEFEKTAYGYPLHEKSSEAGYAAVYSYRNHLDAVAPEDKDAIKREVIRSSLKFADTFPDHKKAAIVLGAAADDLYEMKEYDQALTTANKVLEAFPDTEADVARAAWLVIGHSSYELQRYSEAESAYLKVLALLSEEDTTRNDLMNNLAASIYKQGELANNAQDYRAAADHFMRVSRMAPTSKIRPNAEYDAAAALIQLKDWEKAATVLLGFRNSFPDNPLQPEVTKKIAYVYKENNQLSLAANEYERIEKESKDDDIRRDALQVAAELHEKGGNSVRALEVYRRYVDYFPKPVELNLETRNKITKILKAQNDRPAYLEELRHIVTIDASAGSARTPRTRYLAGSAALVLAENTYETFLAVKLVKPLKDNLKKKQGLMKKAINRFNNLVDYESGELTAAATFYLAEIYSHFSKALMTSERPVLTFDYYKVKPGDNLSTIAKRYDCDVKRIARENNLNKSNFIVAGKKLKIPRGLYPLELEQYELAIEEQAYPFEEKAIHVHESNLKLISRGVYNDWIEKSLQKLAKLVPARYDKPEETGDVIGLLDTFIYEIDRPVLAALPDSESGKPDQSDKAGFVMESESKQSERVEEPGSVTASEPDAGPAQTEKAGSVSASETVEPAQIEEDGSAAETETLEPAKVEETGSVTEPERSEAEKVHKPESVANPESGESVQTKEVMPITEHGSAEVKKDTESGSAKEPDLVKPAQTEEPGSVTESKSGDSIQIEEAGAVSASETGEPAKIEEDESAADDEISESANVEKPGSVTTSEPREPVQVSRTGLLPTGTDPVTRR
jgi:cellulose synthase operon protein C